MSLKAAVHIETALRNGRTVLKNSFCQPPFKITDVTEDRRQKELRLMLMSSSPGTLDGDEYNFNVLLGEETKLVLETQSYGRIFQMKCGAVQTLTVKMAAASSLIYLPHPSVPHKGAVFSAATKIYLNDGCSLLWGEVISCGRKLNNEVFAFTSYHSRTEIFLNNKLAVKENLFLKPAEQAVQSMGRLEGFTHQATLLYLNELANVNEVCEAVAQELTLRADVAFGVSALPVSGLAVRLLGHKAEVLFVLLKRLAAVLQSFPSTVIIPHAHV